MRDYINIIINEGLNSPLPITWKTEKFEKQKSVSITGNFKTPNDKNYVIYAYFWNNVLSFDFYQLSPLESSRFTSVNSNISTLTGTGNAFSVYSTVISGLKYLINTFQPNNIELMASVVKQHEFYTKMVRKMASEISSLGYEIEVSSDEILLKKVDRNLGNQIG